MSTTTTVEWTADMETEMQIVNSASIGSIESDLKYTSLRDVLANLDSPWAGAGPGAAGGSAGGGPGLGHDFDSSTISIKNHLVKHAASAYLQSAAILAVRDQGFLTRVWRRVLRRRAAVWSAWRAFVWGPLEACIGFVARSVRLAVARVAGLRACRPPIA